MTSEEIKKIFRDNIDEMYKDIHTVVTISMGDHSMLSIKKEYLGIEVKFEIDEYCDGFEGLCYIKDLFVVQVSIKIDGYYKDIFGITTYFCEDGNYIKYSKDEILSVIEHRISW